MQFSQGSPAGTGNITYQQKVSFGNMQIEGNIFAILFSPRNTCPLYPCTIRRAPLSAFSEVLRVPARVNNKSYNLIIKSILFN